MIIEVTALMRTDGKGNDEYQEISIGVFTLVSVLSVSNEDYGETSSIIVMSGIDNRDGDIQPGRYSVKETREEINDKIKQAGINNAVEAGRNMMDSMSGVTWTDKKKKPENPLKIVEEEEALQ